MKPFEKEWRKRRDEFWVNFDLFADEHEPVIVPSYRIYKISLPRSAWKQFEAVNWNPATIFLAVDERGHATIAPNTTWFGQTVDSLSFDERREIYDYLVEWGFIELRQVGPEDSEFFTTDRFLGREFESQTVES